MDEDVRLVTDGQHHSVPKEKKCERCGAYFDKVGVVCPTCVNRHFYEDSINRQRDILAHYPDLPLEFNHGSRELKKWHLILNATNRRLGWCGKILALKQGDCRIPRSQRFPADMCSLCLQVYYQLTGQKGVV